ncbi:MAG TPA: NAD-dependent dehydratase [Deltaproteobacteria bacterium]|nr:MAG: NAD-dependent dehydratase [Deltaproteobacteria bacterium GWA2_55_82]OGQ63454.1 MAG: NAD-dependent dehydratase [Deltaproteobacteria bacterium RIFCSPLOWO2_02_FULL_55_12]OIJ74835.1 MAG: NAD-dependent dehydratase [Deltaproteobacteria bacterium GWC2_55_46]HBG47519.1 NAD-dependent dehydratase [Deltaproteobacteria bacterium]HCY11535.1 NAD-dependent dehydratase [Deltaproteobacteria bacterium]
MELSKKKALVTGACGFIGSHLVERLIEEGSEVRAFVCYNSFNSWGWLDSLPEKLVKDVDVFAGDIRDPNGVRKAVEGSDVVFHLAALIGIPFSYHSPDSYIDTNIKGTLNVLQAARHCSVEKVLVTSTSEVYGTARYTPIDESHPRQGQSPYSATKIAADFLAESFVRSFGQEIVIVRPFNTYGPRQSARAVIPTIITQLLSGEKEIKLGSLCPTRDFVYVKDTVEGFLRIAGADVHPGEEINIATQNEISIGALVALLIELTDSKAAVVSDAERLRPAESEVERLLGSNEKLRRLTGWAPGVSLRDGLSETIEWFSDARNRRGYKHGIYNI